MSVSRFEIPVVNKPPRSIRITLPADLFDEITLLASSSGIEPSMVIEHAVTYALGTRKNKRTGSKRNNE